MGPLLTILIIVLAGTGIVYMPIALGSWIVRKNQLREAWASDPHQLPPKKRQQLARLLFQEAVHHHQNGQHELAAETCRRLLRFDADSQEQHRTSRLLVASLFAGGRFEEARDALEKHLVANPTDEAAKLVPAAIYCEQNMLPEARAALDDIDPSKLQTADRALWFNNYAFTLAGLKIDLDLAREYGEKALQLASASDKQFALRTLGVVHLERRDPNLAAECLEAALRERQHLRPGDIEFTKYHLARAYKALGHEAQTRSYLESIVSGRTPYAKEAQKMLAEMGKPKAA